MSTSKKKRNKPYNDPNKKNSCWDDLNLIYLAKIDMLRSAASVAQLAVNPLIEAKLKDDADIRNLLTVVVGDIQKFQQDLASYQSEHKGMTGGAGDPDKYMQAIQIGNKYHQWLDSYNAVILPNVAALTAQFKEWTNEGDA